MTDFTLMNRPFKVIGQRQQLSEADLSACEAQLGIPLPEQLKSYYRHWNGGLPCPESVPDEKSVCVQVFWKKDAPAARSGSWAILEGMHSINGPEYEDLLCCWADYKDRVPSDCLIFGFDPGGSRFLIGIGEHNLGHIYYWINRFQADRAEGEVADYDNVAYIAPTFMDFLSMLREEPLRNEPTNDWIKRVYGDWQPSWKIPD